MENDFLNISKPKKFSKSKDTKIYKIKKIVNKKKSNEQEENKYKSILSNIDSNLIIIDDTKYNLNLNPKLLSTIFDFNFENSLSPPQLNEEEILDFKKFSNFSLNISELDQSNNLPKKEKFSTLSQINSKFLINDMHQSLYNKINIVTKIQSHFRAYIVKKKLLIKYISRDYIKKKSIQKIIKIQKIIRSFLAKINVRKKIIVELINEKRKKSVELIIKKLRDFISIIKTKKTILINYYLEQRKLKVIFIQESFRNFLFYQSFKKLRKAIDKNYFLDYPFNAKKVEILLYSDKYSITKNKSKKFSFVYNKLLNYFILLIDPSKIFSGKYKCQFVVNDIIICDNRYPTIKHKNKIFNIIYLIPKNKKIKYKIISKQKNKIHSKNDSINNKCLEEDQIEEEKDINENYQTNCYNHFLKKSLEDIIEEDDEGKSFTSSSKDNKFEKKLYELSDKSINKLTKNEESDDEDDDFDTYQEYLKLKYKKD